MLHVWGKREVHAGFWLGKTRERGHLEDPGVDGRIILRWSFGNGMGVWTGLIWVRIGTSGGHL
jgi:hypothetical protein